MSESPRVVCLPTLGLYGLWRIRRQFGRGTVVQFHIYPGYLKVFLRWLKVPGSKVMGILSLLFGVKVNRLAPEGRSGSTPEVTFQAQMTCTQVVEALSGEIERTQWVELLGSLIGPREALALFHRRLPWHAIFQQLLAVMGTRAASPAEVVTVLWSAEWPEAWAGVVETAIADPRVRFLPWPRWYSRVAQLAVTGAWVGRALFAILAAVVRRGVAAPPVRVPSAVMIEFIEAARMGGTPVDSNYLEDSVRLRRQDMQYFLTRDQRRVRRTTGDDPDAEIARLAGEGFRITATRELQLSGASRRELATFGRRLLREAFGLRPACMAESFWRGLSAYLEYRLVLDHCAPVNVMHTVNPNGNAAGRLDSAVLTGLCRKEGARSVGYQNRLLYDPVYEESFDCYDLYLAWGRGWPAVLGNGFRFVDKVVEVGCLDNDGEWFEPPRGPGFGKLKVTVLTFEWQGIFSPPGTTMRLLTSCAELAAAHPDCHFQIKTKDPEMVPLILADPSFRLLADRVAANFVFLNLKRHECARIIRESDIVIATAFTSPGGDALLQGKRVIFFSEIKGFGRIFSELPDLVASDATGLARLFEIARRDYPTYARTNSAALRDLDPFRDGKAKTRMLDALLAAPDDKALGSLVKPSPVRAVETRRAHEG